MNETDKDKRIAELERLVGNMQKDCELLYALQAAGVDNWCGYDDALEIMEFE